jgi:hypothetical protein
MLNRFIPTWNALIHSIPISEVKDRESDVLQTLETLLSKKQL